MMPFAVFEQAALSIPYQYRHPRMLYALIRWLRPTHVVEVGTHIGASAVWMARALQENGDGGILTCVDNFCWRDQPTQKEQWKENVKRCGFEFMENSGFITYSRGDLINLVVGRSQEVEWPAKVDFAYIDGAHSSKACRQDLDNASARGATCICANDISTCRGVRIAVNEFLKANEGPWGFIYVPFDAGLLVALKNEPLPEPIQGDEDPWDKP